MFSKQWQLILFSCLFWGNLTPKVFAHGSHIQYQQTQAVEITATYDSGEPMDNAQVVIYAPNDPTTPWLKGTTDEQGNYLFSPDLSLTGNWDVKVRKAGHGTIISIPIPAENKTSHYPSNLASTNKIGYTPLQKLMMVATGTWGFIGTALFFSRPKVNN